MTFFEEFKRLESICNDMFSCKSGVTEYITHMEEAAEKGRTAVSGWDADYKTLKHLRWVRNQIAHNENTDSVATQEDLTQLQKFHKRILSQTDPLCMLTKAAKVGTHSAKPKPKIDKAAPAKREPAKRVPAAAKPQKNDAQPKKGSKAGAVVLLVLVILLVLAGLSVLYLDLSGRMTVSGLLHSLSQSIRAIFRK